MSVSVVNSMKTAASMIPTGIASTRAKASAVNACPAMLNIDIDPDQPQGNDGPPRAFSGKATSFTSKPAAKPTGKVPSTATHERRIADILGLRRRSDIEELTSSQSIYPTARGLTSGNVVRYETTTLRTVVVHARDAPKLHGRDETSVDFTTSTATDAIHAMTADTYVTGTNAPEAMYEDDSGPQFPTGGYITTDAVAGSPTIEPFASAADAEAVVAETAAAGRVDGNGITATLGGAAATGVDGIADAEPTTAVAPEDDVQMLDSELATGGTPGDEGQIAGADPITAGAPGDDDQITDADLTTAGAPGDDDQIADPEPITAGEPEDDTQIAEGSIKINALPIAQAPKWTAGQNGTFLFIPSAAGPEAVDIDQALSSGQQVYQASGEFNAAGVFLVDGVALFTADPSRIDAAAEVVADEPTVTLESAADSLPTTLVKRKRKGKGRGRGRGRGGRTKKPKAHHRGEDSAAQAHAKNKGKKTKASTKKSHATPGHSSGSHHVNSGSGSVHASSTGVSGQHPHGSPKSYLHLGAAHNATHNIATAVDKHHAAESTGGVSGAQETDIAGADNVSGGSTASEIPRDPTETSQGIAAEETLDPIANDATL